MSNASLAKSMKGKKFMYEPTYTLWWCIRTMTSIEMDRTLDFDSFDLGGTLLALIMLQKVTQSLQNFKKIPY